MKLLKTIDLGTLQEWHRWLHRNHRTEPGVWLVFYKKGSGRSGIEKEEAIEEAICYGWIDSLVRRLDDERYAQKFTPRTNTLKWSAPNLERLARLIEAGRLKPAGFASIDSSIDLNRLPELAERATAARAGEPDLPQSYLAEIRRNVSAWRFFSALTPSARRNYVRWILDATREETQWRRLTEAIGLLAAGKTIGLK